MSATDQPDSADNDKDDENNLVNATISYDSNQVENDVTNANNINNPYSKADNNKFAPLSAHVDSGGIPKPESINIGYPKEVKSNESEKLSAADTQLVNPATSSGGTCDMVIEDAVKADILTKIALSIENEQASTNTVHKDVTIDNSDLDNIKPAITTEYKETVIDDVTDSDLQLRWSENEDEIQLNAQSLSQEPLKLDKLDQIAKPAAITGYKETVIDDVSDSELELRWSENEDEIQFNAQSLSQELLKLDKLDLIAKPADITEHKEKVKGDDSDSNMELQWSDTEDEIQLNAQSLSQQALKQLDVDIGDEGRNTEKNEEIIQRLSPESETSVAVNSSFNIPSLDDSLKNLDQPFDIPNDEKTAKQAVNKTVEEHQQLIGQDNDTVQKSNFTEQIITVESSSSSMNINVNTANTHAMYVAASSAEEISERNVIPTTTHIDDQPLNDNALKNFGHELDIIHDVKIATKGIVDTVAELQKSDQDNNAVQLNTDTIAEQLKPSSVDSGLIESSANIKTHTMDVDIPSVEGESTISVSNVTSDKNVLDGQPMNDSTMKDLDVVDDNDKISEIDIDETIVDLKQLIDQDEDTIKQLGLDVDKSERGPDKSNKKIEENQEYDSTIEQKSKTVEKSVVADSGTIDTKLEEQDKQSMDIDLPSAIEDTETITNISIPSCITSLHLNDDRNQDITESECIKGSEFSSESDDKININTNSEVISQIMINKADTKNDESLSLKGYNNDKINEVSTAEMDTESGNRSQIVKENYEKDYKEDFSKTILEPAEMTGVNEDTTLRVHESTNHSIDKTDMIENAITSLKKKNEENGVNDISPEKVEAENRKTASVSPIENVDRSEHRTDELNICNIDKNVKEEIVTEIKNELITPDVTDDSARIHTEHGINRPDVMLDIPTQEFDFDDSDETSEKQTSTQVLKDNSMTAKTVTEIVNQLTKNLLTENKDNTNKITSDDAVTAESKVDDKTTSEMNSNVNEEKEGQSPKETLGQKTDKIVEEVNESEKIDVTTLIIQQKTDENSTEKDLKETEFTEGQKAVTKDDNSKPSTSEDSKMISDNVEEVQTTDSLGLLAESSRVMDDDDEDEQEPEEDDGDDEDAEDDDDDFDPDNEENSNETAEHSEESNPPHSEIDIQEEDIAFGNETDEIGLMLDSNDADNKFDAILEESKDNITIEENETIGTEPTELVDLPTESKLEKDTNDVEEKAKEPISDNRKKPTERRKSILSELLNRPSELAADKTKPAEKSPDKLKNLEISKPKNIVNFVDLEESSSEEDVQVSKKSEQAASIPKAIPTKGTSTIGETSHASTNDKPEKSGVLAAKIAEIFNLDSDDDDNAEREQVLPVTGRTRENNQCINYNCTSDDSVTYYLADRVTIAYYGAARRRRRAVCQNCLDVVNARNEGLISGIKDLRPLMSLRMARPTQQLLEISDSDSEGDDEPIGETGAKLLENQLTDLINDAWSKYEMDERLKDTEDYLQAELEKMDKQGQEIDQLLKDCQKATDQLRVEFYSGFEPHRKELPAISMHDTPIASYACLETEEDVNEPTQLPLRYPKRRAATPIETPAKKQAIPMGYIDTDRKMTRSSSAAADVSKMDEDKDISVVRLSAESAPADLPPPGELVKPALKVGAQVYAMKNQYGAWLRGKILEILPKAENQYTQCRIRFEHKMKNPCKLLTGRAIAYTEPSEVRMTIGTRVIALFINSDTSNKKDSFYYSGVIAEIPNPVNSYRYLVFFDDGYAQYVHHKHTRLVYESSALVWEEVHPFSRDFVCNYLMKYPERAMVRMHPGQALTVEWNGKWWETKVLKVDAALVCVSFPVNRTEWIFRGSTRLQPLFTELQAARRGDRARLPRSTKASTKTNMPYVEYTRTDDQSKSEHQAQFQNVDCNVSAELTWELRRQRAIAKKSTTLAPYIANTAQDGVISRVVYYTPKKSVRPYKMVPHTCGPQCNRSDLLPLEELKTYNPLTKPLLSGWERQIVRHKFYREIMYRAPCGRRLRSMPELHRYLRALRSEMSVDLFDFNPNTHCLAEFVLTKSIVQKKDLSHGKENIPVPCVNYYDQSLPEFCSYNTVRTPTAGVPLNLDPDFLCGCDCEDDCSDKTKCACWKMTLEGARTIGIEGPNVGYEYRRLPEPLPSGIYECNSRCKCKSTCLNRVVQNPLQLKLQVFKTLNRGWGIRALNDVPKGAFLCIYAGNLLTDATANLDGLNEGDEYLAELDYIEVVEAMKEGYEEDIPEAIKTLDKKELKKSESEPESDSTESEDETKPDKTDIEDDDFQPGYMSFGLTEFNKRLRRRDKNKKSKEVDKEQNNQEKEQNEVKKEDDDCITISDDEDVRVSQREPARFAAQEDMTDSKIVPKYRSIRTYFGKDEACYIMDAKVQGNIGRYLNHSCSPNVFVQNVFVDTHDPRFPWVSFFALHHIRAGTELTWNYNYDVGSVPGKVLYCFCAAPNCRGRLL